MNSKSFSGMDLEQALKEGELTHPAASLTGMVKPSEKSGHVSFSQAGCETWIDLPTDMIERADQEGQRPCRDHSHPVVRITLKEPKDAQGKILLALLTQAAPSPSKARYVDELMAYPDPTPETGVSFKQNAPLGMFGKWEEFIRGSGFTYCDWVYVAPGCRGWGRHYNPRTRRYEDYCVDWQEGEWRRIC